MHYDIHKVTDPERFNLIGKEFSVSLPGSHPEDTDLVIVVDVLKSVVGVDSRGPFAGFLVRHNRNENMWIYSNGTINDEDDYPIGSFDPKNFGWKRRP